MTHLASPLQCPAQRLPWRWTGVLGSTMPACGYAHVFLGLLHVCQSCALCPVLTAPYILPNILPSLTVTDCGAGPARGRPRHPGRTAQGHGE